MIPILPARIVARGIALLLACAAPCRAFALDTADPFGTEALAAPGPTGSLGVRSGAPPCPRGAPAAPQSLAELVDRALCANPQTGVAWANARIQAAQVGVARSAYLPSVSVGAGASRTRSAIGGSGVLGGTAVTDTEENADVQLSYLLYDFGARAANLESARALLAAANAAQDSTVQSVMLAAVQAYYQVQAAAAALDAAREAERASATSLAAALARYKAGVATPADRLLAQTAYSQAVLNRITAEGGLRDARGTLASAIGLDANVPVPLAAPVQVQPDTKFEGDVGRMIAEARARRPDLATAEAQLNAARADVDAARAAGMPTVSLGVSSSYQDRVLGPPTSNASLGVTLNWPLFTGYSHTYQVRSAQAQLAAKAATREQVGLQVALDVWRSYQALITATQALRSTADVVASAAESEKVSLGRYKSGVGTILDLLVAQSALANARQQQVQANFGWSIARATLAQSIGILDYGAVDALEPGAQGARKGSQ